LHQIGLRSLTLLERLCTSLSLNTVKVIKGSASGGSADQISGHAYTRRLDANVRVSESLLPEVNAVGGDALPRNDVHKVLCIVFLGTQAEMQAWLQRLRGSNVLGWNARTVCRFLDFKRHMDPGYAHIGVPEVDDVARALRQAEQSVVDAAAAVDKSSIGALDDFLHAEMNTAADSEPADSTVPVDADKAAANLQTVTCLWTGALHAAQVVVCQGRLVVDVNSAAVVVPIGPSWNRIGGDGSCFEDLDSVATYRQLHERSPRLLSPGFIADFRTQPTATGVGIVCCIHANADPTGVLKQALSLAVGLGATEVVVDFGGCEALLDYINELVSLFNAPALAFVGLSTLRLVVANVALAAELMSRMVRSVPDLVPSNGNIADSVVDTEQPRVQDARDVYGRNLAHSVLGTWNKESDDDDGDDDGAAAGNARVMAEDVRVRTGGSLLCAYGDFASILGAFPDTFLFGANSVPSVKKPFSRAALERLMRFSDGRFATAEWLMCAFSMHRLMISSMDAKITLDSAKTTDFLALANDPNVREIASKAADGDSDAQASLAAAVGPMLRALGSRVPFDPNGRSRELAKMRSYTLYFGACSVFLTVAWRRETNILAVSVCAGASETGQEQSPRERILALPASARRALVDAYPGLVATVFVAITNAIVEHIIGLGLETGSNRSVQLPDVNLVGCFGRATSVYGAVETNDRKELHIHVAITTALVFL
jgi:hypothetical protein